MTKLDVPLVPHPNFTDQHFLDGTIPNSFPSAWSEQWQARALEWQQTTERGKVPPTHILLMAKSALPFTIWYLFLGFGLVLGSLTMASVHRPS